jgi:acyl-CoA synthetase (AMP-forming)/AMP-acid ligase II
MTTIASARISVNQRESVEISVPPPADLRIEAGNIAIRLRASAAKYPGQFAVVAPAGRDRAGRVRYDRLTFEQLDQESDRLARGLARLGVTPGTKLVLMVPPGVEFIALTFALFKAGAVIVLVDPGMGRTNIFRCLEEVEPEGFIAVPLVQAIRRLSLRRFPKARFNAAVPESNGRSVLRSLAALLRPLWGGITYDQLRGEAWTPFDIVPARATDPAAIIFTSGSTGPPKGVVYEHGMFSAQVDLIRDFYGIEPGEVDLPGFPLFGLFNAAMGVTTVVPDMHATRPADVDPMKIIESIADNGVTQAFGSPAFWNRVGRYCDEHHVTLPTLRRAMSAGGPVPNRVLERMSRALTGPGADLHTPYGATESLPVASIGAHEVLNCTAARTRLGAGTCVGRPFPRIDIRIIEITDGPIASLSEARQLPPGEIGEIIVRGPSVTREYFNRPDATRLAKIPDAEESGSQDSGAGGRGQWAEGNGQNAGADSPLTTHHSPAGDADPPPSTLNPQPSFWHRMGDVGYLDSEGLLWFCGRKVHVVETQHGRMFSVCCEAVFDEHPDIYRTALVGVGGKPRQRPVIVAEPEPGRFPKNATDEERLRRELLQLGSANPLTAAIDVVLFHPSLPVDTRHNVKINREALAGWTTRKLAAD